jgi:hypothetical protein
MYVLRPALFTWTVAGFEHRATAGCPKNDRSLVSRMSTTYEVGHEPNLHPPAPRSRADKSRQATYEGKPQRKTVNDKRQLE